MEGPQGEPGEVPDLSSKARSSSGVQSSGLKAQSKTRQAVAMHAGTKYKSHTGATISMEHNATRIYMWGSNKRGQLSLASAAQQVSCTPLFVGAMRNKNTLQWH